MSIITETNMSLELDLSVRGSFQPGYAPTYWEPGQADMVEDPEVCAVMVSRTVRDRFGLVVREDVMLANGKTFNRPKYEDIDLLANLSPAAKAEVLAALSDLLSDEIADQLLCDYEPEERDWEAA